MQRVRASLTCKQDHQILALGVKIELSHPLYDDTMASMTFFSNMLTVKQDMSGVPSSDFEIVKVLTVQLKEYCMY